MYSRDIAQKRTSFHLLVGTIAGLSGAMTAVAVHTIMKIKFWGLWSMDAGSAFIIIGGGAWVLSETLCAKSYCGLKSAVLKGIKLSFLAAMIPAALMCIVAVTAAWGHNPNMTFHRPGFIDWSNLLLIGGSWFIVVTGIVFILFSSISLLTVFLIEKIANKR